MSLFRRSRDAGSVYIGFQASWHLFWAMAFTLSLVYQVEVANLTAMQLVLVGTVLELTCFVCELPTGILADLRSRKLSIVIGLSLLGTGIVIVGLFPAFWPILLAQVVWGLGYTFVSGSVDAWMVDEVGEDRSQAIFTRGYQVSLMFNILGILLAGAIAVIFSSLQAPIIFGGAGFIVLATVIIFVMREDNFVRTPDEDRDSWRRTADIVKSGLRSARRPGVVRAFLVIGLLAGLTSEVFDRLWVDRITSDFLLPGWFGPDSIAIWFTLFALISSLIGLLASLTANWLAPKALYAEHPTRIMALLAALQVLGVAVFALAGNLGLALAGRWLRAASTAVASPIQRAWLNRHVTPESRATTLSLMGQADSLGQVAGGPPLGALANAAGIPIALLTASAIQAPAIAVYLRLKPNDEELYDDGDGNSEVAQPNENESIKPVPGDNPTARLTELERQNDPYFESDQDN